MRTGKEIYEGVGNGPSWIQLLIGNNPGYEAERENLVEYLRCDYGERGLQILKMVKED